MGSSTSHYSSSLHTSSPSFAPHNHGNNNLNPGVSQVSSLHDNHHEKQSNDSQASSGLGRDTTSANSALILSRRSDFYYSNSKNYKFCEKSSPKVCGRSADFQDGIPSSQVCSFPAESYLSTGPRLSIRQQHMRPSSSFYASPGSFVARFEFIDTKESGDPVEGTDCDRWFFSHKNSRGSVRSSRNLFLFARGSGRKSLSCSFRFVPRKSERVRIHVTSFNLDSDDCHHSLDTNAKFYSCQQHERSLSREPRVGSLILVDNIKSQQINVGCFCSGHKKTTTSSGHVTHVTSTRSAQQRNKEMLTLSASSQDAESDWITFDLIGPEAIINFTVHGMKANDDFNNFSFEARYEFINGSFPLYNRSLEAQSPLTYVTAGLVLIILILIVIIIAIVKVGRIKLSSRNRHCVPDSPDDHHPNSDLDDLEVPKIWFEAMGSVVDPRNPHHNNLNQQQSHYTLNHQHLNQLSSSHHPLHQYSSLHRNHSSDSQAVRHHHNQAQHEPMIHKLEGEEVTGVDLRSKMMSFSSLIRSEQRKASSPPDCAVWFRLCFSLSSAASAS